MTGSRSGGEGSHDPGAPSGAAGGQPHGSPSPEPGPTESQPTFSWPPPDQSAPGVGQAVSSYEPPAPTGTEVTSGADDPTTAAGQPRGEYSWGDDEPAGRMRTQEPGVTQPRPPTVGEARARDKARTRRAEADRAEAEASRTKARRKKILIGAGAVVGVVGLVAVAYSFVGSDDDVTARCVDPQGVVVSDNYCGGSPGAGGFYYFGGTSYRYNYGGYGSLGQRVSGGSGVLPRGTTVRTDSGGTISDDGTTSRRSSGSGSSAGSGSSGSDAGSSDSGSSVSRGGLGSSSGGSSSGS